MTPRAAIEQLEPTYTPTTHRISKAKKGKRVHVCDKCEKVIDGRTMDATMAKPANQLSRYLLGRSTFGMLSPLLLAGLRRVEHLIFGARRHQLNHFSHAVYRCEFSGCSRTFQRPDLLARHMERQYVAFPLMLTSPLPPLTDAGGFAEWMLEAASCASQCRQSRAKAQLRGKAGRKRERRQPRRCARLRRSRLPILFTSLRRQRAMTCRVGTRRPRLGRTQTT
jgi:hypothetical protein